MLVRFRPWLGRNALVFIATCSGAVVLAVFKDAYSGIIGSGAYDLVKWLWVPLDASLQTDPTLWIVTALLFVSLLCLVFVVWNYQRRIRAIRSFAETTRELINTLNTFDLVLLNSLPALATVQDLDTEIKQLTKRALVMATQMISKDVYRASLFLPDGKNKDVLFMWSHYGIPEESVERTICYICAVPAGKQRGVAGEAFRERKSIIAHITEKEHGYEADRASYIFFNRETVGDKEIISPISYRSFACVPLLVNGVQEPLGVLCLDSPNQSVFDLPESKDRLQALGDRFVAILLGYQKFKKGAHVI